MAGFSLCTVHCGSDAERVLVVQERSEGRIAGRLGFGGDASDGRSIEFSATRERALSGEVDIEVGALRYGVHYDYAAREVVSDGEGGAIDRATQRALLGGIELITQYLGPDDPTLPLHEQMLYAALSMLAESGGMPLDRLRFELEPVPFADPDIDPDTEPTEIAKSLGNDGIGCIKKNRPYFASWDYDDVTVSDAVVTSNVSECNGRCGPTCTQLSPWNMWTLDCLEHDSCCNATSTDTCWTPLGECGDEYGDAEGDFLRGFDPFRKHCGG